MGLELHSGGFLILRKFSKIFELTLSVKSRRWIATSQRWIAMSRRDNVAKSQRRGVERSQNPKPLSRSDVGSQRRDVGRPYFVPLSITS